MTNEIVFIFTFFNITHGQVKKEQKMYQLSHELTPIKTPFASSALPLRPLRLWISTLNTAAHFFSTLTTWFTFFLTFGYTHQPDQP
jgi:hypothetical protein